MGLNMRFSLPSLALLSLLVLAQLSMVVHSRLFDPQYPVEILSVETGVHVNGEWFARMSFSHLESIEAVITLRVTDLSITQVYLTFTAMDSEQHPVLFKLCICTIEESGIQEVSVNLGLIPSYSSLGDAALYSNVLSGLPSQGGKPLSLQNRRNFMVWWSSADVNRDYSVNVLDVVTVCASYGRSDSDPLWNARCDIATPYRYIDIYDVLKVMDDYSEQWSPQPG
jgi:hypothetical protein